MRRDDATASDQSLSPAVKAEILVEALPYIRRFWDKVVVVKYGGNALGGGSTLAGFATDIVLMRSVGMRPVVVHGGGPQIGELMERLGKKPEFRDGLRVTDAETLDIARMVLVGKVNRDIVSAINVHGPLAVGVSGEDAGLIQAAQRDPELGFVGDISEVKPELLVRLLAEDLVPVVATIGSDETGQAYNINADTAAAAIAIALEAQKLVFLTDVEGIRADLGGPVQPPEPSEFPAVASADRKRGRRRRHDPQGSGRAGRGRRGSRASAHPRRAGAPRCPARDFHPQRDRHDGDGMTQTSPQLQPQAAEAPATRLMSTYAAPRVTFVRGEGSYLWDDQGRRYVDFLSGPCGDVARPRPSRRRRRCERGGADIAPHLQPLRDAAGPGSRRDPRQADRRRREGIFRQQRG